jgi:hypothetical protein
MVPAVGDSDLSPDGETRATPPADLLRAGDADAIARYRDARAPRVGAYVAQVCPPDLAQDAVSAAFVDFLARVAGAPGAEDSLDELLLAATRSAAAGRFTVASPPGRTLAVSAECHAMPELLAAHANRERPTDEGLIGAHLASCSICTHTLVRMQDAERAFAQPSGELPAIELRETVVDTTTMPPARHSEPKLEPESRGVSPAPNPPSAPPAPPASSAQRSGSRDVIYPPPAMGRRRSGGLVGAIRRFSRPKHS